VDLNSEKDLRQQTRTVLEAEIDHNYNIRWIQWTINLLIEW
jgi:hypothetical protein